MSRRHLHRGITVGERIADRVVGVLGSWRFILIQTAVVAVWLATAGGGRDPFPYILLNLAFSTQAAYASPLILMAGNRQAATDQRRDDHEAEEVHLTYEQLNLLHAINAQQLEILQILRAQMVPAGGEPVR